MTCFIVLFSIQNECSGSLAFDFFKYIPQRRAGRTLPIKFQKKCMNIFIIFFFTTIFYYSLQLACGSISKCKKKENRLENEIVKKELEPSF
jgi:hypothetical protein